MKARIVSAAVVAVLVVASQASASVISASSQTARSKPADKVDYLSVTAMQGELNASTREAADASAPTALGSKSVPSTTSRRSESSRTVSSARRPSTTAVRRARVCAEAIS